MTQTKSVIITGANSGLGFECAKAIASAGKGWHIVIACRNPDKGEKAKKRLTEETGFMAITVMELDLASFTSVRGFAEQWKRSSLPPLQGLINNAGIQVLQGLEYTKDGYELSFGTNHLGHFLLTRLLLDALQEPARIVVVSSGTHDPDTIEGRFNKPLFLGARKLALPAGKKDMTGLQRYATSKLANVLFAYELARKLQQRRITVNAFDPAAVPDTNLLGSVKNPLLREGLKGFTRLFKWLGVRVSTPQQSGAAMARLLLDERLENVSGKYFQVLDEKKSSRQSYDPALAAALWTDSDALTGLDETTGTK